MKVAVITGASRGIGREAALALSAKGLSIFVAADSTDAELRAVAEDAAKLNGAEVAFGLFDLMQPGAAEAMVAAALARFGRVDVLVNNAGIRCRKPIGEFTQGDFSAVMAVNLAAPLFASQAVLPAMRRQGGGRIIHVASQMGRVAQRLNTLYGASKAALIHLAKSMALELAADNIQVNTVSPGPIMTQYNLDRWEAEGSIEEWQKTVPGGRLGQPGEVAELIAFLATCEGRFIQGADLLIDGGYLVQ